MSAKTDHSPKKEDQSPPKNPSQGDIELIEEFQAAALWMAIPRKERLPETQDQLAKQLKVSPDSISDWKKRDDFWKLVSEHRQRWVKDEISDVVAGLIKRAKHGSAPEVKLFLQFAGEFTEVSRRELTGPDGGPIKMQTLADLVVEAAQPPDDSNTPADTTSSSDMAAAA